MTETVVHVTTLEQWKSVLDVWFKQGYVWYGGGNKYNRFSFKLGSRYLCLLNDEIWADGYLNEADEPIGYADFMSQQKEDNKMETYYVTQEQLDSIEELKSLPAPLVAIMNKRYGIESLYNELPLSDTEWFNYLSGVNQIEFKVNETSTIEPEDETLTTPTEEPNANREVTIVFQNGEMKSFIGVTDISLNNSTITFNYQQGAYGNTIMEATFYTDTISGYIIDTP